MNVNRELLAFLRKQYPVGTRVRLDSMQDPYAPVEAGMTGKLDYIDDAGQFHMKWDNGRTLALIPGVDSFTVLPPELSMTKLYMPLTVEMPEDSLPKLLIGGKQKQRSRIALGHTVAAVFPMRPSFSVGITEEEAKGLPVQLISQPSLQRTEQPSAEALPRQSVQLYHAGLDALLQTDAFIQVAGVSAVISRAVFAAYIVGTVAKAAADASASARLMTGWRHHLHLCGEQGCELHKISRQIISLLSGNKKGPESYC